MASARTDAQHTSPSILHGSARRRSHIASDALPLPVNLTNTIFAGIFCWASAFLLKRWREKVPNSTPLYQLSMGEILGILASIASVIYLLGFCGIVFVQPFVSRNTDSPLDSEGDEDIPETEAAGNIPEQPERKIFEDEGLASAVSSNQIPSYSLEAELGDCHRAASVRKRAVELVTGRSLEGLPLSGFDYSSVLGQCCEMVIGHVQIPVGVAGPLKLDGMEYMIPMATTEGCLVASTNRGCKAISQSGGATSILLRDGMSRAPVVKFPSVKGAADLKFYLEDEDNFDTISAVFNRTSRFARLHHVKCAVAGMNAYLRFSCATGDAMGMNMISKGVQNVLDYLQDLFPDMEVISISGNFCADKKPTAVNWIEGRGKSVVCEAIIKEEVVTKILKTSVSALIELNTAKNLVGSAMAGSVGGFNAHASNIVSAIFIATGQDPAQNIESSHCITVMEAINGGRDLHISVTMPSIEVGTVGGGTQLASQAACLDLLGVKGSNNEMPGRNAQTLAKVVAGGVLAGELSLMSALAAGQLVKSHMRYNRSSRNIAAEGTNNPKGKAAGRVCFSS